MKQAMDRMFSAVEKAVAAIRAFTPDTELSNELRSMCNNVKGWKTITGFLRDEYLVSRWAWVLGAVSFGALYVYIAVLFSFVYFGVSRVGGISFSWANSLVAALFIPLFATELPRTILLRVLGGIHFTLALTLGIGTFFSFLQRRLVAIRAAATIVNDQLIDKAFEEKFLIVSSRLEVKPGSPPAKQTSFQEQQPTNKGKKKKPK